MNSFVNERDKYKLNLFARAASTSMKAWFWFDLDGRHDEFLTDPPTINPTGGVTAADGKILRIQRLVNPLAAPRLRVGSDYQIFTVVRNPFIRLVSAYLTVFKYKSTRQAYVERHGEEMVPGSFDEFVTLLSEHPIRNAHWRPQAELLGPSGRLLRFENLQEGFEEMCSLLGKTTGKLPRYNAKRVKEQAVDASKLYTRRTADIVRYLYAGDFERYGYSTELSGEV